MIKKWFRKKMYTNQKLKRIIMIQKKYFLKMMIMILIMILVVYMNTKVKLKILVKEIYFNLIRKKVLINQ